MTINEVFKKYPSLFLPYNIEYLFDIYSLVNEPKMKFHNLKEISLEILRLLLEYDILFILNAGNKKLINEKSNDIIINYVDEKWTEKIEFPEIYNILFFGYSDWYLNAIRFKGFDLIKGESAGIIWSDFAKNIINFEKWVNENKDKKP